MKQQREHWGSHLGMIMAAAGSAIGLGTLWQFPYLVGQNGGGLFVLVYLVSTFVIGVPVFIVELVLGRRAQRGAVGVFDSLAKHSAFWKGVGWLGVITSFIIMSYYSVVAGWGLNYILMSLNQFYVGKSPEQIGQVFIALRSSAGMTLFWNFVFTAITVGMVYQGIRKGIEYWSRIMIPALIVLLLGLFVYSTTLSGFKEAFDFIFTPNFKDFKPSGILTALGMALMPWSLGQGIILTYGSYMKKGENIPTTACIIGGMDIIISIISALMIFPIIFTCGVSPQAGSGLVFQTLPILFARLPGALIISTAFFALFTFTALTSSIALIEVVVANFIDLFQWSRKKAVLITGFATFLFGIPSALAWTGTLFPNWETVYGKNFFDTMVSLIANWTLPVGGLLTAVFGGWFLSKKIAEEEFITAPNYRFVFHVWRFFVKWVAPAAIILIILQSVGVMDVDRIFRFAS